MTGNICTSNTQRARYVVADLMMSAIAFVAFNLFRYQLLYNSSISGLSMYAFILDGKIILEQLLFPVCMVMLYVISGFYNKPFQKSRLGIVSNTLAGAVAGSIIVLLLLLLNDAVAKHQYYILILALTVLLFVFIYSGRIIINGLFLRKLKNGEVTYTAIIVGDSTSAAEMAVQLRKSKGTAATKVLGFVHLPGENRVVENEKIWDYDEVTEVCRAIKPDNIIIATETKDDRKVMRILDKLITLDISIKIAPDTLSYVTANIKMGDILGTPFVDLSSPSISDFGQNIKRCGDIFISLLALILLSPLYLILSIAVKCSSAGPVIYSQERIGRHRKPFRIYKFRSMYENAESGGPQLTTDNDSRITHVGEVLRKYRLDELPQFWNVLKGDMSLVGPRPEREYYINQIMERAPYYGLIFQVRPGITSWGMVKFGYASTVEEMVERSRFDIIYLNNMSILTDLKILAYTVRTVAIGEGK